MFNYKQLVKSAFAIHKDDFYNLYISIEERNAKENKNFEPWSYKYNFLKPNCYLVVECNENGNAKFFLNVNNQTYTFGGKERNVRELVNESEVFQSVMEENHLNFYPKYSEEFKKAILSADKGTIIMLNTKRMIVCVGENEQQLFFKDCFSGDLKDLKLESFSNSKVFTIDKNSDESIQHLFEYAYNTRSLTANIRVSTNSQHGAYEVTNIENSLKNGEISTINVGPIELKVIKNENMFFWYDSNNKKIDRKIVETLFGWVILYIPEIKVDKTTIFLQDKLQDVAFIQDVQQLIKEQRFDLISNIAFQYSKMNNVPTFLNIQGFEKQENGSYDMVTFVFKDSRIFKIKYKYTENQEPIPLKPEEIFEENFISFCKQKYDETICFLKTQYTPLVEKYKINFNQKESTSSLLKNVIEEHIQKTPPLVNSQSMKHISDEVKIIVLGSINNKNEKEYDLINAKDIVSMEDDYEK